MAKRNSATRARPIVVEGENENDRFALTGIYKTSLTNGYAAFDNLDATLNRIEQNASEIKKQASAEVQKLPDEYIDVGPCRYNKKCESLAWGMSCAASTALMRVAEVRKAVAEKNTRDAAFAAISLGRAAEELFVRQREHLALIGLRQANRNAKQNELRSAEAVQKRAQRRKSFDDAIKRQVRNHERHSVKRALAAAATECGCSVAAIRQARRESI